MEVKELISQLNLSEASGPNGIPTKILQLIKNELCKPLNTIYNRRIKQVLTINLFVSGIIHWF